MKRILITLLFVICAIPSFAIADCENSSNHNLHISIAQVHERLVSLSWPKPPPGARIEGYAIFQVGVTTEGKVNCISPIGGHPLLLSHLASAIAGWKFRSQMPFLGIIVVRFSSSEGFVFL
jgi:hypothetical protein